MRFPYLYIFLEYFNSFILDNVFVLFPVLLILFVLVNMSTIYLSLDYSVYGKHRALHFFHYSIIIQLSMDGLNKMLCMYSK